MKQTIALETITPEIAKKYISSEETNRKTSEGLVDVYAADMFANKWELNGETIKFNGHGGLVDGRHRLLACIQSNAPFNTFVVRNIPSYKHIDIGRKRTLADGLLIFGGRNFSGRSGTAVSGALSSLLAYAIESRATQTSTQHRKFSHAFRLDFVINDPHFKKIIPLADEYLSLLGNPLRPAVSVALLWLASVGGANQEEVHGFLRGVRDGTGLSEGDPALAYRDFVIACMARKRVLSSREAFRSALSALVKHLEGKKIYGVKARTFSIFPNASPDKIARIMGIETD